MPFRLLTVLFTVAALARAGELTWTTKSTFDPGDPAKKVESFESRSSMSGDKFAVRSGDSVSVLHDDDLLRVDYAKKQFVREKRSERLEKITAAFTKFREQLKIESQETPVTFKETESPGPGPAILGYPTTLREFVVTSSMGPEPPMIFEAKVSIAFGQPEGWEALDALQKMDSGVPRPPANWMVLPNPDKVRQAWAAVDFQGMPLRVVITTRIKVNYSGILPPGVAPPPEPSPSIVTAEVTSLSATADAGLFEVPEGFTDMKEKAPVKP